MPRLYGSKRSNKRGRGAFAHIWRASCVTSCGRPGGRSAPSGSVRPRVPLPPPPPPPPPRFPAPPRFPVPDRARAVRRDGRRHALADRAAAAQAVAAPPSGGCMRRPLPVGLSPRSGRSFAPGRRFPVCGVDSAVIHPPDSSASRCGLRGHSRWPRGRRGITLPPEQRVVLPLLARVLRCAAPRLCCLPGCPSRPHRPHPLPHPLPLRLGPRHCRCRCLRHSRRRFPPPHPLRRRRLRCSPSTLTPARAAVGCGCPRGTARRARGSGRRRRRRHGWAFASSPPFAPALNLVVSALWL